MKRGRARGLLAARAAIGSLLACLGLGGAAAQAGAAAHPVSYTGFTITDGRLGAWSFHNARVTLSFIGDTSTVQTINPPNAQVVLQNAGTASVLIATPHKTVRATFAPNQIFVSLDLGTPDPCCPLVGGRGVGFGSFTATGDFDPAYPLGVEDGVIDWGDATNVSPALTALPLTLTDDAGYSGRAFLCPGFPDFTCPAPTRALATDKGDLFLDQPYRLPGGDPLQAGFVLTDAGVAQNATNWLHPSKANLRPHPITYSGYVVADATLGGHFYPGAQVYLSFESNATKAVPYTDATSHGYIDTVGSAEVKVTRHGRTVTATVAPGQLYVFYDVTHASIGFGSTAGGRGYPLVLTANDNTNTDVHGLVENSSLAAATDILTTPTNAANYSPATASLVTDLTNATVLSGAASACAAFDPATSTCTNFTQVRLATDHGAFSLSEPDTADDGSGTYSINWGMFWTHLGRLG